MSKAMNTLSKHIEHYKNKGKTLRYLFFYKIFESSMKLFRTFLIVMILGCQSMYAQEQKGKIFGKALTKDKKSVEIATVILKKGEDGSIKKMTLTDSNGDFEFENIDYGKYSITITSVEFQPFASEEFTLDQEMKKLDTFEVLESSTILKEVVVKSERQLIEHTIDKTIVNVESSISAAGGSAMEVLEKSPGITIGRDGSISLRGKQGVTVYIDGRPSFLSGGDLANLLRGMPASQLSQIEIMTNPSAKYDAAGNGVINLRTKKSNIRGFNGSFVTAFIQGRYASTTQNLSLNYRSGNVVVFSNLSYADRNGFEEFGIVRNLKNQETNALETIYDQNTYFKNNSKNLTAKLGLDYNITQKTTIGFLFSGFHNPSTAEVTNTTLLKNAENVVKTTVNAPANNDGKWQNTVLNLNLRHQFDSTGRELLFDAGYVWYGANLSQKFNNTFLKSDGSEAKPREIFSQDLPRDIAIYNFKADYTHPFSDKAKLEAGIKFSQVATDNNAQFFNFRDNTLLKNDSLSNHFIYNEQIKAAYLNYNLKLKKFEIQLGLRAEQTKIKGEQKSDNQVFERDYANLFPTAYFTYTFNPIHKIGLNYGRRIERPDYRDLNPFRSYYDRYTYDEGNPYLRPQFSHNFELSHYFVGGALTTTLSYNTTNDIIQEMIFQNTALNETFKRPENLNSRQILGISVGGEMPVSKVWSTTFGIEFTDTRFEGIVNAQPFTLGLASVSGQLVNQFKFDKGWKVEIAAWYASKSIYSTFIQSPFSMVSAGVSKTFWEGNGTLRLSSNDIFNINQFTGTSQYQNIDVYVRNKAQTQTLKLTFTYRFKKGSKIENKDTFSPTQEMNRVNTTKK
jgi:iron complex outermembrane recepter protein